MKKEELIIRFANISDLPCIVDIYNQAIRSKSATGDMEEFSVENRIKWFEKFDRKKYPLYIIELNKRVVGYCTLSEYRPGRQAMSSVAEISYYIDYSFHRKGIGTVLMKYVITDCKRIGIKSLLAFIMDINSPTIGLLEKFNFEKWGHFPGIIEIDGKTYGHMIYGLRINKS